MRSKWLLVIVACIGWGRHLPAQDVPAAARKDMGALARQLLGYDWQPVTHTNAEFSGPLVEFIYWMEGTLPSSYMPRLDAPVLFHRRTNDTCDALRIEYKTNGVSISIIQTSLAMLLTFTGTNTVVSDAKGATTAANNIERSVFELGRGVVSISLDLTHDYGHYWVGAIKDYQLHVPLDSLVTGTNAPEHGGFGLDQWWADGKSLTFLGMKVPPLTSGRGTDEGATKSLELNQRWFGASKKP